MNGGVLMDNMDNFNNMRPCASTDELEYDFRCLDWDVLMNISYTIDKRTGIDKK